MKYIHRLIFIGSTVLLSLSAYSADSDKASTPAIITLAGGCFWCLEADYDKIKGVLSTTSGFAGGSQKNPSYKQVSTGQTNHIEAVQIEYDPQIVSYRELVDMFWKKVDPTDGGGQFCDRGPHYRTAIFPHSDQQHSDARQSLKALSESGQLKEAIATDIIPNAQFYPAEDYHQDYYTKNPIRYKFYRYRCGRDQRLEELWGKSASSM